MRAAAFLLGLSIAMGCTSTFAEIYRCSIDGKTIYQERPCEGIGAKGASVRIQSGPALLPGSVAASAPALVPAAPVRSADVAPPPASPLASAKDWLDQMADVCLDWYRPLLKDPRGAYYRDASYDRSNRVLSITVYGTNSFGGVTSKPAACEIKGDSLDEGWTKLHAKRRGWEL